jgi:hypothetical protein
MDRISFHDGTDVSRFRPCSQVAWGQLVGNLSHSIWRRKCSWRRGERVPITGSGSERSIKKVRLVTKYHGSDGALIGMLPQ